MYFKTVYLRGFLSFFLTSWTVERDLLFVFGENGRKFVSYTWRREWMVTNCIVVFLYTECTDPLTDVCFCYFNKNVAV